MGDPTVSDSDLAHVDAYWRAANHRTVGLLADECRATLAAHHAYIWAHFEDMEDMEEIRDFVRSVS